MLPHSPNLTKTSLICLNPFSNVIDIPSQILSLRLPPPILLEASLRMPQIHQLRTPVIARAAVVDCNPDVMQSMDPLEYTTHVCSSFSYTAIYSLTRA